MPKNLGNMSKLPTEQGVWEVSPLTFFGLCGFTLYLSWAFMLFLSPALNPDTIVQTLELDLQSFQGLQGSLLYPFRLVQLLALLLCLIGAWRASNALSQRRGIALLLLISVLASSLGFLLFALPGLTPVLQGGALVCALYALTALLWGIAQACMIVLWSTFLSMIDKRCILLFTALCVGAAGILTLLMSFLLPLPALWITCSLTLLEAGCFLSFFLKQKERPSALLVKAKESDRRMQIHVKSTVAVVFYSAAIGFAVCYITSTQGGQIGILTAALAITLAAAIMALDATRLHLITENFLVKLHMPAVIVGIAPLFFDNHLVGLISTALLLCFFMVIFIVNLSALSEHVRIFHLNPIRIFGFGRADNVCGFLAGALICYLAFFAPFTGFLLEGDRHVLEQVVLLCFLGAFILATSFVFEDHYPKAHATKGTRKKGKLSQKIRPAEETHDLPRGDLRTLTSSPLTSHGNAAATQSGMWGMRIAKLSDEYALSPKEAEVLFLLAKGRNAEYIQNELVVSRHTAKAHIYHIYQKTGVHSRQDLIDLLENTKVGHD